MRDRMHERVEFLHENGTETLLDLSAMGAAFCFSEKIPDGAVITISVNDLVVSAKVVYCHARKGGYRIGVHFSELSRRDEALLATLVSAFSCGVPLTFFTMLSRDT